MTYVIEPQEVPDQPLPDDENPPEAEEGEKGEATGLEDLSKQKDELLIDLNSQLQGLERILSAKEDEISALKQAAEETGEKLKAATGLLSEAVSSYRALVIESNPEVVGELITGDTVESINESLVSGKNLVSKVKQGLETEISFSKVPAGAPERTSPDLSSLSPREKIQHAIGRNR